MNFQIGKIYSFNTRSPVFLGARVERVKLKSIADLDTARKFAPVDQLHAQVYPGLPEGTPRDPAAQTYYIFEAENGSTVFYAASWVIEDTIEVIQNVSVTVTIPQASIGDVEKVRVALSAAGIKGFDIKTS